MMTNFTPSTKIQGVELGNVNLLGEFVVQLLYVPHVHFVFELEIVGPMIKTTILIYLALFSEACKFSFLLVVHT